MTTTNAPAQPPSSHVPLELEEFLRPLEVDIHKIHALARSLCETFGDLAKESQDQFLQTPISDEVLNPEREGKGRYLAIDIGGSNLRVGFIELLGASSQDDGGKPRVNRFLEKSWRIDDDHKANNTDHLFAWIGRCIAEVVQDGVSKWGSKLPEVLPMGVTFSFPMIQNTLSEAIVMNMGKGFDVTSGLNLGQQLLKGYASSTASQPNLPRIKIAAIANDTVATLVSFAYQFRHSSHQKASMALIVGTGCNATIPLAISKLHPSKRPKLVFASNNRPDSKIIINTEWSINGSAPPLHSLNFVTKWDTLLDTASEFPGFMPFEQMTSGRYIGELGRLIILEYFTVHLGIPIQDLPPQLLIRNALDASILATVGRESQLCAPLEQSLPFPPTSRYKWTPPLAHHLVQIAKKIEIRAAGLASAAIIGLLACADEIHLQNSTSSSTSSNPSSSISRSGAPDHHQKDDVKELMVGYTGSCIVGFQDYLADCQEFLDKIMRKEFAGDHSRGRHVKGLGKRVVLEACHDGGIIGAGILAATVMEMDVKPVV